MLVNGKRNQRIVFRDDQQRGNADSFQILIRRLRFVVVRGGAEAEQGRRVVLVEVINGSDSGKVLQPVDFRRLAGSRADFSFQRAKKAAIINKIFAAS